MQDNQGPYNMNLNSQTNLQQKTADNQLEYSTIDCIYCQQYHLKKDLAKMMCPKVMPYIPPYRQITQFECRLCRGDGQYIEVRTIRKMVPKKQAQRLVIQFQDQSCGYTLQKQDRRVTFFKKKSRLVRRCEQCDGTGKIKWMKRCCSQGCSRCKSRRRVVNPIWAKQKMFAFFDSNPMCRFCNKEYSNEPTITGKCQHKFHLECVKAIKSKRLLCPICEYVSRRTEIYPLKSPQVSQGQEDEPIQQESQN